LTDAVEQSDQRGDTLGHAQLYHARDHRFERIDRFADEQLLSFRELARREYLEDAFERVAQVGERGNLDRTRRTGERVHRSEQRVAHHAMLAQGFVLALDHIDMCARLAAEDGEKRGRNAVRAELDECFGLFGQILRGRLHPDGELAVLRVRRSCRRSRCLDRR